ncbi:MAG TPA: hypothetical protein VIK89_04310 [Cytophagaceae bacterium]
MRLIALFLLLILTVGYSYAQTFEVGSGVQLYRFKGEVADAAQTGFNYVNDTKFNITAVFLGNIPIKKFDDNMSIGISPNLSLGTFYDIYSADIPVFATFKVGTTATKKSTKDYGAGFGLGYQFSAVSAVFANAGYAVNYNTTFFSPVLMAEASADLQGTIYKLRVDAFLFNYNSFHRRFTGDISQINIRIIKTFL